MSTESNEVAQEVMDSVPLIMRTIRAEMRSHRESGLSVPQFRAMLFIHRNQGISLSKLADHLGLTAPTTSKMIDGLVIRHLVYRNEVKENRRQIQLNLSEPGEAMLNSAQEQTRNRLARMFDGLSIQDQHLITTAMIKLKELFT
jgi:DNA-binding MarR family transcriptional regulator